ncbi:MAG TPA: DUF3348 domain-containing protein [Azospira sp.]|nr:DUF3348 domain-containing protein [Azospira sp.]
MKKDLPRASLTSSRLIRLLTELTGREGPESRQTFAERLGQWMQLNDAIALSGIVNAKVGGTPTPAAEAMEALAASRAAFARVRTALAETMDTAGVCKPGRGRVKLQALPTGKVLPEESPFAFLHRYYLAQQRSMEAAIAPLRAQTREAVTRHAPALRQVAALDGVLEKSLGERERQSLATIPLLLEKRFQQLCQTREAPDDSADGPPPAQPEPWLQAFCQEMQSVLLAELEIRLEPVAGLIEAFGNEVSQRHE